MQKRPWPRSVVLPIVLIVLGIALLLGNMGVWGWNVWEFLVRFWPLWLIAVGLDLMIGRGSRLGSAIVAGVTILMLLGGIVYVTAYVPRAVVSAQLPSEEVNQPLAGAQRADVTIGSSVGELTIHESTDASLLVSGNVWRLPGESIEKSASNSGDTLYYTLRSHLTVTVPTIGRQPDGTWDLGLSSTVPMNLKLSTGVGKSHIDLSRLNVTSLELNTGVGETTLTLPRQSNFSARVNTGVGQTSIVIPGGMAYRVRGHQGIGAITFNGDHLGNRGTYASPDYDTATNQVDLEVNGGIGEVRITAGN